jgi:hypothetical protein
VGFPNRIFKGAVAAPRWMKLPQPVVDRAPRLDLVPFKDTNLLYLVFVTESLENAAVKVTLVQALRLCTGRTVYRGSRGIALLLRH